MGEFLKQHYYTLIYSIFFVCSLSFSFLINSLFLRFFHTLGIRNRNDGTIIRWGAQSKPAIGGLTFYILFLISVTSFSFFFNPEQMLYNLKFVGLLISMALGFVVGLYDDAYDTKPILKFFVQLLCGIVMILTGVYIEIFQDIYLNYLFTLFWVVGIMNAINMLDNMDAITTIVSVSITLGSIIIITAHADFENMHLFVLVGVLSSLVAFLYYNWYPSRMYMGDTGSQFLGVFLAYMGITYFWNDAYPEGNHYPSKQFITALLAFCLPIIDTTVVVIKRLSKKQSPFIGGKDHTTHSLVYHGFSDRMVAGVFALISLVSLTLVYIIQIYVEKWTIAHLIGFGLYFLLMLALFLGISFSKKATA